MCGRGGAVTFEGDKREGVGMLSRLAEDKSRGPGIGLCFEIGRGGRRRRRVGFDEINTRWLNCVVFMGSEI